MKTIGLIGGMSWESTVSYYRIINETIRDRLGGLHSAKILMYSVDFDEVEKMQHAGDWSAAGELLADAAVRVESAGADFIVLCTNTMHLVAPAIEAAIEIPILHIADATAAAITAAGCNAAGLLGTAFTMEQDFYKERLRDRHGLRVLVPDAAERAEVHRVIYEELCRGKVNDESRRRYRDVMAKLVAEGADCIILGCTEISLLVSQSDSAVALFDTTEIHARRAADLALQ
jgi:aspartate racemase